MVCPRCGHATPAQSGRCAACGAALAQGPVATGVLTIDTTGLPPGGTFGASTGLNPFAATTDRTDASESGATAATGEVVARPLDGTATSGRSGRTVVRPALSHHPAARHRRHGRGLSGVGRGARVAVALKVIRPEVDGGSDGGGGDRAALQARAAPRPPGHAQERRPHSRPRRDRRHQVHHDAVHRGRRPRDRPASRKASCRSPARAAHRAARSSRAASRRTRPASCTAT